MKNIFPISFLSAITMLFALADQAQACYSPTTGRFINRDPSGERGGENLYAFVRNDAVNEIDRLGLQALLKKVCKATIDVGHGGGNGSRSTIRADERIKGSKSDFLKCDHSHPIEIANFRVAGGRSHSGSA